MPLQEHLQQILISLLQLILNPIILITAIITIIVLVKKNKEYKNGAYYQITKLPYSSVKHDTGRYGEYLTYKQLKNFETTGAKFLFNIYIPKENGETTEIDVLMICSKGLFVFESKNYSGWIFGNERYKNWYQTLPAGRGRSHKERFYNPIMQNRSHIKHLKVFLGRQVPMHSIIVFSNRCTLKSIQIESDDISVINRYDVAPLVLEICDQIHDNLLNDNDIADLYNKLYPYTQVDDIVKAQHITSIHYNPCPQQVQENSPLIAPTIQSKTVLMTMEEQSQIPKNAQTYSESCENKTGIENPTLLEPKRIDQANKKYQTLKCPKCSGNLVLRTATRGAKVGNQFYGCTNYPKCKYIQNITSENDLTS